MSNPRSIAQVTTAASALQGAGVTMDVSAAALFAVGQLVELYPQQYGDGAPLARAGMTVRYLISAIAGAQLTGTLNPDAYLNPPQVETGWIIDGRDSAGVTPGGAGVRWVDGISYPRSWQGIWDAAALGPGKVLVSPGAPLPFSATPPTGGYINFVDDLQIDLQGTEITMIAHANPTCFSMAGQGPAGTARLLSANTAKAQNYLLLAPADVLLLQADGLELGSVIQVYQDPTSVADDFSDKQLCRVWAIDQPGGALYISPPTMKPFLTAQNAKVINMTTLKRAALRNARFDGAEVNQASIFCASYWNEDCEIDNIVGKDSYGPLVWNFFPSFNLQVRHVGGTRLSIDSVVGSISLNGLNNSSVEDVHLDDGGLGMRLDAPVYTTVRGLRVFGSHSRQVRLYQAHSCTVEGVTASGSYDDPAVVGVAGLSGLTLGGDSEDNSITNVVAMGNPEAGVLLTHVPGSSFVVKDNYIQGRALNNASFDVGLSGDIELNDLDVKGVSFVDGTTDAPNSGNSLGDDFVVDYPHAASSYTASGGQTWAPTAGQVATHNYVQRRHRMTISTVISGGAAPSAACTGLRQRIPNGRVAAGYWRSVLWGFDGAALVAVQAIAGDGLNYVEYQRADGVQWNNAGAAAVYIVGQITLGVE